MKSIVLFLTVLSAFSYINAQSMFRFRSGSDIKNIQVFGESSGIAYTSDALYRTDDGGISWRKIGLPLAFSETISGVRFNNENNGAAIFVDENSTQLRLASTANGGSTWMTRPVNLPYADLSELYLGNIDIEITDDTNNLELHFLYPTSSNFKGEVRCGSTDGGENWQCGTPQVRMNDDSERQKISGHWSLKSEGKCFGFKTFCQNELKIFMGENEITPPQIKEFANRERENLKQEAKETPMFALRPGGSTRISLNRGFDKCQAGSVAQMQTWWNTSHHYDTNIYMSGRNRACPTQPFTNNPAWINSITAMGWGLIPTIVGYQSPCTSSATTVKLSYDPVVSEQQGRLEADIAIADANSIGLTQGTVLYYDMERYDPPTPDTLGCRVATVAFLKGWTDRVKQLGYISGVYGSPKNAQEDWVNLPAASKMDIIWMARWDNIPSVWTYISFPNFPTNEWTNHQRIKQWQAPHNETWGGVTFNIDGNIADGPVAGLAIPKNKRGDFDGDQKTDISVFRPDTGVWYVLNSSNSSVGAVAFGGSTDILAPGDFDNDGRTDYCVFRPENGAWYMLTKAGFFHSRQFGASGDIPVPADYNGDGKTDVAVFRPSNGVWYIANSDSLATFTIVQFGISEDKPVQADYDGDGKDDIAVWRPSNGAWYGLRSSDGGFFAASFGISTDRPVQADYDADGRADFAVFRDGTWYLLQSYNGFAGVAFGTAGDIPVPGRYDGDARYDIAVYRPSNGVWYLLQSQNGFAAAGFGIATDRPVPNAYLP